MVVLGRYLSTTGSEGSIMLTVMNNEEGIHNNNINNDLVVGGDRIITTIDYVLEQSKLVVGRSTISLNVTTLIDLSTKHILTTNNGCNMAIVGDTLNLAMDDVQIPPLQDNVNPPLPTPSLDGLCLQPFLPSHLGIDSADENHCVEQVEDASMFTHVFSITLNSLQKTTEGSLIYLFPEQPEDIQQETSDIVTEDCEQRLFETVEDVDDQDEYLAIS